MEEWEVLAFLATHARMRHFTCDQIWRMNDMKVAEGVSCRFVHLYSDEIYFSAYIFIFIVKQVYIIQSIQFGGPCKRFFQTYGAIFVDGFALWRSFQNSRPAP